jgi:hypothetical protein
MPVTRATIGFALALLALAGCSVDGYLTCGAPCEDGGSSDATLGDANAPDAGDASSSDAGFEGGCKGDGGYCQQSSDCCSSACNQNGRCAASCVSQGGACGGSTCCIGSFCSDGGCTQCYATNATCTSDNQCCSGSCNGGYDGGAQHCSGG